MNRKEQFLEIANELAEFFQKKNTHYGDDYFTGKYSDIERWMSIKRKVARLSSFYEKGNTNVPDETLEDTWKDLAIYCVMELMLKKSKK